MKRIPLLPVSMLILIILSASLSPAQEQSRIPSAHWNADFLLSTPGASSSPLGGFVNPAAYGMMPGSELQFFWSDDGAKLGSLRDWGLFTGLPNLGFGIIHRTLDVPVFPNDLKEIGVTDYRLALAGGSEAVSLGLGYGWSRGYPSTSPRDDLLQIGLVQRPCRHASIGLVGAFALGHSDRKGIFDLAVRPLGNEKVTLFGDVELQKNDRLDDAPWSIGAAVEPVPGVQLVGRYFDTETFTLGVTLSLGGLRLSSAPHYDDENELGYTTYGVSIGYKTRNIFDEYFRDASRYLSMDMKGTIAYRKYRMFDDETHTLSEILFDLEDVITDSRISGVGINLSGMNITRVMAWEIREKLQEIRETGKKVVIYIDRGEMVEYHLASVADRVVMDPAGMLFLPGYILGRTFIRSAMEKMGLGVDEWRFFKYKSAYEFVSRESMSDADREQRQALIDDFYDVAREDVCASRNISHDQFDDWVDENIIFPADSALVHGLVDTLGRWEDVRGIIATLEGENKKMVSRKRLASQEFPPRRWGEAPKVAIVYGLGVCQMDEGIKARQLEKVFQRLKEDNQVKAVVFRVDSPGGDGLASDLVAEALRKCALKKPVIVSQGNVAGSGGYWISMYGDTIVAAPGTVTGSIGVIGTWIWNKGLGDRLGMISDHVKVGEHADFGFGITLPFLGIMIPDRPVTPEERDNIENLIKAMYKEFLIKVAAGRGMTVDEVDAVGQGRVWSGIDGMDKGLVDVIGGLDTAISLAKEAAGISGETDIDIVEMPSKGLFKLPFPTEDESFYGMKDNREWLYFRMVSENPGFPLPLLPPDLYPEK